MWNDLDTAVRLNADRDRLQSMTETLRRSRWLQETGQDEAGFALLDPLTHIPAARFASLAEGCFPFLAAAGNRVELPDRRARRMTLMSRPLICLQAHR
jgi:hypothetical protein